jgi:hypothetical protein
MFATGTQSAGYGGPAATQNILDFLDWTTINSSQGGATRIYTGDGGDYVNWAVISQEAAPMGCGGFGIVLAGGSINTGSIRAQSGGLFAGGGGAATGVNTIYYPVMIAGSGGAFGGGGGGANSYYNSGYTQSGFGGTGGVFVAVTEYA